MSKHCGETMCFLLFAVILMLQHVHIVLGTTTISFNSYGYLGNSTTMQCKTDALPITSTSANWYLNGGLIYLATNRFTQNSSTDGFSLAVSNLVISDGGNYHCTIKGVQSSANTLTILYNTQERDVNITSNSTARIIMISIIGYPDPIFTVTVVEVATGTQVTVSWGPVTRTTDADGVFTVLQQTTNSFDKEYYNVTASVTSTKPDPIIVRRQVNFTALTTSPTTTTMSASSICIATLLVLFCSGCLDCCRRCRKFTHCSDNKTCYATWYFMKKGGCSFFFSKSSSNKGESFCGNDHEEHCEGCLSSRKKCTCGWPGNCKYRTTSHDGPCVCVCCVKKEEDQLTLHIANNDEICRPAAGSKVEIPSPLAGHGCGKINVQWIGPQGDTLTSADKYKIKEDGSLIIVNLSSDLSGRYTCQAEDEDGFLAKDSIKITAHGKEKTKPDSKWINDHEAGTASGHASPSYGQSEHRTLPHLSGVLENKQIRPQPLPPGNNGGQNKNFRGLSVNYDDAKGLPNDKPLSNRLPPRLAPILQPNVGEEIASEEYQKKKKMN